MLITCLFISCALGNQSQSDQPVEFKINHRRASQMLQIIERSNSIKPIDISADDLKGCLTMVGSPDKVHEVRDLIRALDVVRKRLSIKVNIDSEADKESYQVTTKIYDQQKWRTGDGDTGLTVAIEPRLNPDRTVTLLVDCERSGVASTSQAFRMKLGTTRSLMIGTGVVRNVRQTPEGKFQTYYGHVTEPKVTIRIDG